MDTIVGVYPRAGGGTTVNLNDIKKFRGLSPRRRGNLSGSVGESRGEGSIPAQAGEPRCCQPRPWIHGVYPRAGGGTGGLLNPEQANLGLSPRRRGNHRHGCLQSGKQGSIPAQAGEPGTPKLETRHARVYPRAGGEPATPAPARFADRVYPRAGGGTCLSPRVRR